MKNMYRAQLPSGLTADAKINALWVFCEKMEKEEKLVVRLIQKTITDKIDEMSKSSPNLDARTTNEVKDLVGIYASWHWHKKFSEAEKKEVEKLKQMIIDFVFLLE